MFEVQMEKDECLETCEADEKEAEAFQKIRSWSRNRRGAESCGRVIMGWRCWLQVRSLLGSTSSPPSGSGRSYNSGRLIHLISLCEEFIRTEKESRQMGPFWNQPDL